MRISDWSADVCSSDLSAETELFRIADPSVVQAEVSVPVSEGAHIKPGAPAVIEAEGNEISARVRSVTPSADPESRTIQVVLTPTSGGSKIGRASCRERVCQYV